MSVYAKTKVRVEETLRAMASPSFTVTALRQATVYGVSPRMRFDAVVNRMTLHAFREKRIRVHGGGKQWRPLVHVGDVAGAFMLAAHAAPDRVNAQVFNVGSETHSVAGIASIVASVVRGDRAHARRTGCAELPGEFRQDQRLALLRAALHRHRRREGDLRGAPRNMMLRILPHHHRQDRERVVPIPGDLQITGAVQGGHGHDHRIRVRILDQGGVVPSVAVQDGEDLLAAGFGGGVEGWESNGSIGACDGSLTHMAPSSRRWGCHGDPLPAPVLPAFRAAQLHVLAEPALQGAVL